MFPEPDSIWHKYPLMAKLEKIMPKKPKEGPDDPWMFRVQYEPIRSSAEAFVHYLDSDLPTNEKELRDVLWVFGELLCGYMEKMLNQSFKIADDLATCTINPVRIMDKESQ